MINHTDNLTYLRMEDLITIMHALNVNQILLYTGSIGDQI
jgi:hypothetical protein